MYEDYKDFVLQSLVDHIVDQYCGKDNEHCPFRYFHVKNECERTVCGLAYFSNGSLNDCD